MRSRRFVSEMRKRFRAMGERGGFRLVDYSIQRDHLHLIVEANGKATLACGMKSLGARVAGAVNRVFGRSGAVLAGRYHVRWLTSPREMRHALRYVLLNARKHARARLGGIVPPARGDEASSGALFEGWRRPPPGMPSSPRREAETQPARSWLRRVGWRGHGLIDPEEVPGRA